MSPADRSFLERTYTLIQAHLHDQEFTVEELAAFLNCDRSHLLRRLRELIDQTPSALIRGLRLRRSEELLRAQKGSVSEIAFAVGFKSLAHFSNAFKKHYGERPTQYAARQRIDVPAPEAPMAPTS